MDVVLTSSPIQRLPDEVIARLFVVGCWLPGRIDETILRDSVGHPPRLKPFAKLVGSICIRWRCIINWPLIYKEVHYAKISLRAINATYNSFPEVLLEYLRDLNNYRDEGVDLDLHWECRGRIDLADEGLADSLDASVIKLFMHGMNLTAPALGRARSLHAYLWQPEAIDFCFMMLNDLDCNSRLAHVSMYDSDSSALSLIEPNINPPAPATFSPIFASPGTTWTGCHLKPSFHSLSHLSIIDISVLGNFTIPPALSHLTITSPDAHTIHWPDLQTLIIQGRQLISLILITRIEGISDMTSTVLHNMAYLTELTVGWANIFAVFKLLLSLRMPGLKRLILENILRRDNDGEITDSPSLMEIHKSLIPVRRFLAPADLCFKFSDEGVVELLLEHMALDFVNSLQLFYWGDGFSDEAQKAAVTAYHLPALSALSLCADYGVAWTPFMHQFVIPQVRKLAYVVLGSSAPHAGQDRLPYLESWVSLTTGMATWPTQISDLTMSLSILGAAEENSHPFSQLSAVKNLTLSNVEYINVNGIKWLAWPSPDDTVPQGKSGNMLLPTMPHLKSINIMMDYAVTRDREKEFLRKIMQVLQTVLCSRKLNGHPVQLVSVVTARERLCWYNSHPGYALEEVQTFLEEN